MLVGRAYKGGVPLAGGYVDIRPGEAVKRCEVAQMLYNLFR